MKESRIIYTLIFCLVCSTNYAQINDQLKIDKLEISSDKTNGFDNLNWKSDNKTKEIGKPEMPIYKVSYVLPVDAVVTGVTFKRKSKQKLDGSFYLYPAQEPIPTDDSKNVKFTAPDSIVYESNQIYPKKLYEIESDRFLQGYHILTLIIYPFEYIPQSRTLSYYTDLDYTIEYALGGNSDEIRPLTQTVRRAQQCKDFVKSIVKNIEDVDIFGSNALSFREGKKTVQKNRGIQKVKALSVYDEIVPEYIIITCDSLKSTFQILADWKSKKGVFTIIKTTEEIANNYSGIDLQEKIRKYIIDAYTKWGAGLYILLGGDANIVPARMVLGDLTILRPSDRYFASYKGTWNENGDAIFLSGESMTTDMGVILGRAPVENNTEASVFNKKVISYERADSITNLNYFNNYLFLDEYLTLIGSKLYDCVHQKIRNFTIPNSIVKKYIYDNKDCTNTTRYDSYQCAVGDMELDKANFISCLNTGANLIGSNDKFHFIYAMHHCSPSSMGTSSTDKHQSLIKDDMSQFANGNYYQIFMSGGCEPADFNEDCIAERYLNNPNGGGVAFIGNSDQGHQSETDQFQMFQNALHNSGIYNLGRAFQKILTGGYIINCRLHLLGDPEMPVWTNAPDTLQVSVTPQAVLLGEQNVNVKIDSLPVGQKALVCIRKGTEVYFTSSISDTTMHTYTVIPETEGEIDVTVTVHNFIPYEATIGVNETTAPHLFVKSVDFLDSTSPAVGNGNGKNDAGETIQLRTSIKNSGINAANNVTVTLNVNSPQITILNNQASIGSLASGDTTNINFLYSIDKNTKEILSNDTLPIRFNITMMDANNTIWRDTFNIDVFTDSIRQGNKAVVYISNGHSAIEAGDTVRFIIDLKNIGKAPTKGLKAKITADSTYIQSCSSVWQDYPVMNFNEVKQNTVPFEFVVANNYLAGSLQNLKFTLTIQNEYGKEWNYNFDLYKPVKPTGLDFTADSTEIYPTWSYTAERSGFNIYRCKSDSLGNPVGSYVKINTDSINFRYYQDKNLQKLTRYLYKVSAISKSGNEGELSDPLLAWTSLAVKKYHYDFGSIRGGITTVDVNNDGKKEIFAATRSDSKGAHLLGVDCNGQELFNIDGNVTTLGAFGKMNGVSHGTPAISEMAPDGTCKIYGTSRDHTPFRLYCFSNQDNDNDFKPDLLGIGSLPHGNITGAILSNMDNSQDGSLEPVVICENGNVALFNSNLDTVTIIPQTNTISYYGAIAVADIDSGGKEIIKAGENGIYIWKNDASSYMGINPFFNLSTSYPYPSVLVCDIDNDGKKEIITAYNNKVYAIRTDTANTIVAGWNQPYVNTIGSLTSSFSVGDLNRDGKLEIVVLGTNMITVLDNNGNILSSLTMSNLSPAGTPIIADVDGDSENEIIFGSTSGVNKNIYALNMDLTKVLGFPLKTDETANCVPSVSDIDGDGKNEIVLGVGTWIYIWKTDGIAGNVEWGCDRYDQYNTGEYQRNCNSLTIKTNEIWSSNHNLCGDLILQSGVLKIDNQSSLTMANAATLTVMSGATLEIDSGHILNANVRALAGSNVIVKNNGSILLRTDGEFFTETGALVEIYTGSIDK